MLPLGPPDRHGSPYKSASAFAAWPGLLADPRAPVPRDAELDFRERNAYWIDDWSRRGSVADQVRFDREWAALRSYAEERGVRLIGDVPIYVAPGSVDHRTHRELFRDDAVAGTPPDAYTDKGQLWGNPLYDWPALQRRGYRWWTERLRRTFELYDLARIDHFRGFCAYWEVPLGARDARRGRWRRGPGRAPFDAASRELGELPVIAENLGVITEAVERLRTSLGYPGMVVLQFGFGSGDPRNVHTPSNHREDTVVYTGTHDNDTVLGLVHVAAGRGPARGRAGDRRRGRARARAALVADPPRPRLAGAGGDGAGAGRARARVGGAHEHAGAFGGRVEVAAGSVAGRAVARRLREVTEAAGRTSAG